MTVKRIFVDSLYIWSEKFRWVYSLLEIRKFKRLVGSKIIGTSLLVCEYLRKFITLMNRIQEMEH